MIEDLWFKIFFRSLGLMLLIMAIGINVLFWRGR